METEMKISTVYLSENRPKQTPIAKVAPELKQHREQNDSTSYEISKACAVLGCEESKNLDSDSFFRFPEDSKHRQIWTELTGRSNWTPTDFSYICALHFSDDAFVLGEDSKMYLSNNAIPCLKLPGHVLEVEYIDEETLENETTYINNHNVQMEHSKTTNKNHDQIDDYIFGSSETNKNQTTEVNVELLKLFTEVQKIQRQAVGLQDKLIYNTKIYNQQKRSLKRLKEVIELKEKLLKQKNKRKCSVNYATIEKIKDDSNGLILAMPTRYTDDIKDFALSIYKYSPQAYIYVRNALRTALPSTEILNNWINSGYVPKNMMANRSLVKVLQEQTETELTCKICLH
ncbi:THAP domain-containing protein 2 [Eumeta japonica]|uniref:THAP domain-containing protein 2 n=1 Tax=Eumeta variegata TaxID=151549 RepID=A0A4C1WPR2_EUMVA|nr:THAP domain-containing protein 2 [Eumeta japonica]